MKKCIIFGAGSAIAQNFIKEYQNDFSIHAFARHQLKENFKINFYQTDYTDLSKYQSIFDEVDNIIYCIGVTNASDQEIKKINSELFVKIFKYFNNKKNVIFISSAAILFNKGAYVNSKLSCENYLRQSIHNFISLRPSVMHGEFDENNLIKMQDFIKKMPFIPVIAPKHVIQPVYMRDITKVFARAIEENKFTNKLYTVSGPKQIQLIYVFKLLKKKLNSKKLLVPIPLRPVQLMVKFLAFFLPKDLIMAHQILNMKIHEPFNSGELEKDYHYQPRSFEETIFKY